jgi:hypothetical protein
MSEATGCMEKSQQPQSNECKAHLAETSKDTGALQKPIPSDLLKRPWVYPPTRMRYHGLHQDDSTYAVICGLRTIFARFLIWFNLPLCWFVGITIATGHIERWLDAHFSGSESTVAITFVVIYIGYTIFAHTAAVFAAIGYELWWNPYARAPTLRGEVGREEEVAMVMQNRVIARRMGRMLLPCLGSKS